MQDLSKIRLSFKPPGCPKVLASFWRKTHPRPQKSKFLKKITPNYSPKEQVCQIQSNPTKFPGCPDVFVTERRTTDTETWSDSSSTEFEKSFLPRNFSLVNKIGNIIFVVMRVKVYKPEASIEICNDTKPIILSSNDRFLADEKMKLPVLFGERLRSSTGGLERDDDRPPARILTIDASIFY